MAATCDERQLKQPRLQEPKRRILSAPAQTGLRARHCLLKPIADIAAISVHAKQV
jgi:hypothetical protein